MTKGGNATFDLEFDDDEEEEEEEEEVEVQQEVEEGASPGKLGASWWSSPLQLASHWASGCFFCLITAIFSTTV